MRNDDFHHVENYRINNLKLRPLVMQGDRWVGVGARVEALWHSQSKGAVLNVRMVRFSARPDGIVGS